MTSPFKFLDSYTKEDRDIYFGREAEIEALYSKVFESKLLLVYGVSGTGKSSLLHCGLANKFNDSDWLPVSVRRAGNINDSLSAEIRKVALTPVKGSLRKQINSLYLDHFKPVFLLFDQFEELFVFGSETEKKDFVRQLKDLINSDVQCRCIFVIREEYLALLTEFESEIPQLLQNRIRIERLTKAQAKICIEGPCETAGIELENGFAEYMLTKLAGNKSDIELTYLQVFLDKIYRTNPQRFSIQLLDDAGNVSDLLGSFLEEQVQLMPNPEQALTVLKTFVSSKGTKRQITVDEISIAAKNLGKNIPLSDITEIVTRLASLRILRDKDENDRFELPHDALAAKIYEKITLVEKELMQVQQFIENAFQIFSKTGHRLDNKDLNYISIYENMLFLNEECDQFLKECKSIIANKQKLKRRIRLATFVIAFLFIAVNFSKFYRQYQQDKVKLLSSEAMLGYQDDFYSAAEKYYQAAELDTTSIHMLTTGINLIFNIPDNEYFVIGERLPVSPEKKFIALRKDSLIHVFSADKKRVAQIPLDPNYGFKILDDSLLIYWDQKKIYWKDFNNKPIREYVFGESKYKGITRLVDDFYIIHEAGEYYIIQPQTKFNAYLGNGNYDFPEMKSKFICGNRLYKIKNKQLQEQVLSAPFHRNNQLIFNEKYIFSFDSNYIYVLNLEKGSFIQYPVSIDNFYVNENIITLQDTAKVLWILNKDLKLSKQLQLGEFTSTGSKASVLESNKLLILKNQNQYITLRNPYKDRQNLRLDSFNLDKDVFIPALNRVYQAQNAKAIIQYPKEPIKKIFNTEINFAGANLGEMEYVLFNTFKDNQTFEMVTKTNPFQSKSESSSNGKVIMVTNPGFISFLNLEGKLEFGLDNHFPDTSLFPENQTDISFDNRYVLQSQNGRIVIYSYGDEKEIKQISVSKNFINRVAWSKKELTFAIAHHRDSVTFYQIKENKNKSFIGIEKLRAFKLSDDKEYYEKNLNEISNRITDIDFHPIDAQALLIGTSQGHVFTYEAQKSLFYFDELSLNKNAIFKASWTQNPYFILINYLQVISEKNEKIINQYQSIFYNQIHTHIYFEISKSNRLLEADCFHPKMPVFFDYNQLKWIVPEKGEIKVKKTGFDHLLNDFTQMYFDIHDGKIKNRGEMQIQLPYTTKGIQKELQKYFDHWGDMLPFRKSNALEQINPN